MATDLVQAICDRANPIRSPRDLKPLVDRLSKARIVMLGESTHGTHEFYDWRRMISMRLLTEHGFNFIAVEGDWPPCWELGQSMQSQADPTDFRNIMANFNRWPTWMWANTETMQLAEEIKSHNRALTELRQVGFYGLDVYSLFESMDSVVKQLERINPFLARRVRLKYACFERFHQDERVYAKSLVSFPEGCKREVVEVLQDLLRLRLNGFRDREEVLFDAQQNARITANAEHYYRAMILSDEESWNIRDRHMMETLDILMRRYGENSKSIVWAHNTHVGDYRATDMLREGLVNLGGLARQEWGKEQVALVGFGTYEGQVIASHSWDGPIELMQIPPARVGSYEVAFHRASLLQKENSFFITLGEERRSPGSLCQVLGHRAIGVVYLPTYERFGNYVPTSLANRYDVFIFIDQTTAVEPLIQEFKRKEIPETWPRGQ